MELQFSDPNEINSQSSGETYEISNDTTYLLNPDQEKLSSPALNQEYTQGPLLLRESADIIDPQDPSTWGKVGRNDLCPCGSGKKFKHCHGAV
jgi:uncharacterized protein YecA (UPF0149 family)